MTACGSASNGTGAEIAAAGAVGQAGFGGALSAGGAQASAGTAPALTAGAGGTDSSGGSDAGGSTGVAGDGGAPALAGASNGGTQGGTAPISSGGSGGAAGGDAGNGGATESGGAPSVGAFCPAKGTPCRIMPLGDSITFGYGATTGGGYREKLFTQAVADGKSITFVGSQSSGPDMLANMPFPKGNEGHSGYSIDDSSKTMGISPLVDNSIATYKPNIILLMIGTNDMHYSIDLGNAPTRLGKLLDQIISDAPNALLVVAQIIPANGTQNTPTQTYNAAIPALIQARAGQGKHIALVNMYAALKAWSSSIYKDSEHPNDAGYALMAQTWYPAIKGSLP